MTKGSVKPNLLLNIVLRARGKNAIDGETRQIINKFMDEMGVPRVDYDNVYRTILKAAYRYSIQESKKDFTCYFGGSALT